MSAPAIDEARFAAEWEQDQELLAQLAANGDIATIERTVDVSFIGREEALEARDDRTRLFLSGENFLLAEEKDGKRGDQGRNQ